MNVYRRFFEIRDAATLAEIERLMDQREHYQGAIEAIKEEVEASEMAFYQHNGKFAGFRFAATPDRERWRKVDGGLWYPKKKSKEGKELAKRIEALSVPRPPKYALELVGITPDLTGALMEGVRIHIPSVAGSSKAGWFACIPWQDVNPAEIEDDKAAVAKGETPKHQRILLWEPPEDWVEVREWQVEKAMEEARAA